jgi:hypothetical protein
VRAREAAALVGLICAAWVVVVVLLWLVMLWL